MSYLNNELNEIIKNKFLIRIQPQTFFTENAYKKPFVVQIIKIQFVIGRRHLHNHVCIFMMLQSIQLNKKPTCFRIGIKTASKHSTGHLLIKLLRNIRLIARRRKSGNPSRCNRTVIHKPRDKTCLMWILYCVVRRWSVSLPLLTAHLPNPKYLKELKRNFKRLSIS